MSRFNAVNSPLTPPQLPLLPLVAETPAVIRFLENIFHAWTHTVSSNWAEKHCSLVLFCLLFFPVFFFSLLRDIFSLFPHNTKQQRRRYRKHDPESPCWCCNPVSGCQSWIICSKEEELAVASVLGTFRGNKISPGFFPFINIGCSHPSLHLKGPKQRCKKYERILGMRLDAG